MVRNQSSRLWCNTRQQGCCSASGQWASCRGREVGLRSGSWAGREELQCPSIPRIQSRGQKMQGSQALPPEEHVPGQLDLSCSSTFRLGRLRIDSQLVQDRQDSNPAENDSTWSWKHLPLLLATSFLPLIGKTIIMIATRMFAALPICDPVILLQNKYSTFQVILWLNTSFCGYRGSFYFYKWTWNAPL